jgi:hypothetical protein
MMIRIYHLSRAAKSVSAPRGVRAFWVRVCSRCDVSMCVCVQMDLWGRFLNKGNRGNVVETGIRGNGRVRLSPIFLQL